MDAISAAKFIPRRDTNKSLGKIRKLTSQSLGAELTNEVYEWASAVVPKELSKELYNAGTGEGFIANQVKVGDDFKVSYDSSEGSPVFFFVQ